ncbi:MAG: glycosyltransferase [Verrucomicrobia bacterium]|nr:glycosyltransferase [Verrucomicrobiota bacterium]
MSLYFDVTKSASSKQLSGLLRVSGKLRQDLASILGDKLVPVVWNSRKQRFRDSEKKDVIDLLETDHFVTPEIFSSQDRPGYIEHLENAGVQSAAIFHDSIPLKYPDITWPKSVAGHPQYMKDLARFKHVFSVSKSSQDDLIDHWNRLGLSERPTLSTLILGADFFDRSAISWAHSPQSPPLLLNVGIIEPRKNQSQLLDVASRLWDAGLRFELHFVGRINPHFGKPIEKKIKIARRAGHPVYLHSKQSDGLLYELYAKARFTVFNSIAEGFGLPVVESLWLGIPCISQALPSLTPLLSSPACKFVGSVDALEAALRNWITDQNAIEEASAAAGQLNLSTWADTATTLLDWTEQS